MTAAATTTCAGPPGTGGESEKRGSVDLALRASALAPGRRQRRWVMRPGTARPGCSASYLAARSIPPAQTAACQRPSAGRASRCAGGARTPACVPPVRGPRWRARRIGSRAVGEVQGAARSVGGRQPARAPEGLAGRLTARRQGGRDPALPPSWASRRPRSPSSRVCPGPLSTAFMNTRGITHLGEDYVSRMFKTYADRMPAEPTWSDLTPHRVLQHAPVNEPREAIRSGAFLSGRRVLPAGQETSRQRAPPRLARAGPARTSEGRR